MSSLPPPPDAPDVLPGEDGGAYIDAEEQRDAQAERLMIAWLPPGSHARMVGFADVPDGDREEWRRVAREAEAMAAEGDEMARLRKIEKAARWFAIAAMDREAPPEVGPQMVADLLAAFGIGSGVTDADRYVEAFREVSARVPVGESAAAAESPPSPAMRCACGVVGCTDPSPLASFTQQHTVPTWTKGRR